ncbi:cell division protein FtsQ [Poseidonocella pacifica]|uniref:Cell division protein FtsQ n=1 Tax=Poseidonocella pacifica TaxID=871651 RepID=A0A1I0VX63_9RHOB|nr:cell division protein FtsQ/DivIB [Poseidonocella pacifica]SFA80256.1 cell division protein FtsQ [Poseidonocella pacifica]
MRPLKFLRRSEGRADPAPSRWAYRVERLWLRPRFRKLVKFGVPIVIVAGTVGGYFANAERREDVSLALSDLRASIEARPEFAVNLMAIDGAAPELAGEIRDVLPLRFPVSSFDLDLEEMRKTVLELDAVAEAALRIRPGGVLALDIRERIPAVVWKHDGRYDLLDESGAFVATLEARGGAAALPLIAGKGAQDVTPEALDLVEAAEPLGARFLGLVRMGERRWDVILDRDQRILLPATSPVRALERAIALSEAQDMLSRDIAGLDLRNPKRPTLRLSHAALAAYHEIRLTGVPTE